MGYRRVFVVRKDLKLSSGKMAAQIGHCVEIPYVELLKNNISSQNASRCHFAFDMPRKLVNEYINGSIVKTICEAKNKTQLLKAGEIAKKLGLKEGKDFGFVYDNCLTELEPEEENGTCLTCFWTVPLPDETAHKISKKYQLYKE